LSDHSKKAEENIVLEEIGGIKEMFSKCKIYTPMDKIIKGLVPPDEEQV
jgi:hypothetical protein